MEGVRLSGPGAAYRPASGGSSQILNYARKHRRVTVNDMVILTGVCRNTLKEHFRKLVANGQLGMRGKGRCLGCTSPGIEPSVALERLMPPSS